MSFFVVARFKMRNGLWLANEYFCLANTVLVCPKTDGIDNVLHTCIDTAEITHKR